MKVACQFIHLAAFLQKQVQQSPCLWNGMKRPCYLFARKFYPEALNNLLHLFSNFTSIWAGLHYHSPVEYQLPTSTSTLLNSYFYYNQCRISYQTIKFSDSLQGEIIGWVDDFPAQPRWWLPQLQSQTKPTHSYTTSLSWSRWLIFPSLLTILLVYFQLVFKLPLWFLNSKFCSSN